MNRSKRLVKKRTIPTLFKYFGYDVAISPRTGNVFISRSDRSDVGVFPSLTAAYRHYFA